MMLKLLRIGGRRIGDDRGSVGVLVALVMFFVLGMLTMTYNSARLSTEKIRLQNAADAAALEHAAWQARGMNMVQNLNNEAYVALRFADEVIVMCCFANIIRRAVLETILILRFLEPIVRLAIKAGLMMAKWLAQGLVAGVIAQLEEMCKLTPLIGYGTAQQLAQANGATPQNGAYAIGFTGRDLGQDVMTMFKLPLVPSNNPGKPFVTDNGDYKDKVSITGGIHAKEIRDAIPEFNFHPLVSEMLPDAKVDGNIKWKMPAPVVWMCYKDNNEIRLAPLSVWDTGFDTRDGKQRKDSRKGRFGKGHGAFGKMVAIGAAQCITGDVVRQSVTARRESFCIQRPAGLGTGASAKLVPVADALPKEWGELIFH